MNSEQIRRGRGGHWISEILDFKIAYNHPEIFCFFECFEISKSGDVMTSKKGYDTPLRLAFELTNILLRRGKR